jgi:cell division protein DivIC
MRRRKRTSRRSVFLFTFMSVGLLFAAVSYKKVSLDSNRLKLEAQRNELQSQKKDLKLESKRIKESGKYVSSAKFIEDTAREKLNLIYPNEIVFKPESE